jgi:hypothetical protein
MNDAERLDFDPNDPCVCGHRNEIHGNGNFGCLQKDPAKAVASNSFGYCSCTKFYPMNYEWTRLIKAVVRSSKKTPKRKKSDARGL